MFNMVPPTYGAASFRFLMDIECEILPDDEFEALDAVCRSVEKEYCQSSGCSQRLLPATLKPKHLPLSSRFPTLRFPKAPVYYKTFAEVDEIAGRLLQAGSSAKPLVLGFDVEWAPSFIKGRPPRAVALIQICTQSHAADIGHCTDRSTTREHALASSSYECYLLHIRHSGITPRLSQLLTSPTILKVGVGIRGDALKIATDYGVSMSGILDLGTLADEKAEGINGGVSFRGTHWSLASLARFMLRGHLPKHRDVRCSNWETLPLSMEQQMYAATDAWVGLRIYEEIFGKGDAVV